MADSPRSSTSQPISSQSQSSELRSGSRSPRSRSRNHRSQLAPSMSRLKAYGYVRVSSEEQAREGISLDAQEEKIKTYATLHDLDLIEIIRDEGYSGKNLNRPGLQRLLGLIEGSEPEAVIVYKLDRLTRRTRDLLHLIEDVFSEGNTRFLSITEQIDTATAMGKFFLTVMGALAQMEREVVGERTSAALAYKKSQGDTLGKIPYGYMRLDGKLIEDQQEQKVLRRIRRMRKDGMSYQAIAQHLNQSGVPPRQKQAHWQPSSVHYILNRRKKR
jgi:site-specific DNA recombinase